jgi:SpoVK/Ycf46/Vps4 family AAA+-type ATPase
MVVDANVVMELLEAALSADYTRLRRAGNRLAKLAAVDDPDAGKAIQRILKRQGVPLQASGYSQQLPRDTGTSLPLIQEAEWPTDPLLLNEDAGRVVARFLEDARHIELLADSGVSSRLGLLLHGEPGTGKSHLAGHVAAQLHMPLYVVRLDSLISSRLGDTAKNIRNVFDFIPGNRGVLFLDELDAVAKVRDDQNEVGELKRVVNTVLQSLDSLSHEIIVVGATNHAHLLDRAIWRRFPYKIEMRAPDRQVLADMWRHYLYRDRADCRFEADVLSAVSDGLSGADVENIALAARRRAIIDGEPPALAQVLLAAHRSRPGAPSLLDQPAMSHEHRRDLAIALRDRAHLEVTNIARAVGVSRQMAHRYLKEAGHAE